MKTRLNDIGSEGSIPRECDQSRKQSNQRRPNEQQLQLRFLAFSNVRISIFVENKAENEEERGVPDPPPVMIAV